MHASPRGLGVGNPCQENTSEPTQRGGPGGAGPVGTWEERALGRDEEGWGGGCWAVRHPWEARDWQSGQPWTDAVPGGRAWGLGPGALSSPTHVDLGMGRQDQYPGAGRGAGGEGSPGPRLHGPSAVGAGNPSGGRGATQPHQTPRPHPSPGLGPLLLSTMVTWATSGAGSGVLGPTSQLGARPGTAVGLGTGLCPRRRPATGSRLPRCSGLGVGKAGGRGFAERPPGGGALGKLKNSPNIEASERGDPREASSLCLIGQT